MSQPVFSALTRALHKVENFLLVSVLMIMLLLAVADIALRTITGGSVIWIQPALQVLVLWLGLLGALYASRSQEHIAIDVISRLVGPLGRRICGFVGTAFAAAVCGVVAWFSIDFIQTSIEYEDIAFSDVPAWPLQIIIPVTFGLMGIRFVVHAMGYLSLPDYQPNPELKAEAAS